MDKKAERWLPRGIAFATINYRMQPKAPPLEQARDVARALAAMQQNWQKIGVDRSNIVLMGHSAGAHLIALLATRPELLTEAGAQARAFVTKAQGLGAQTEVLPLDRTHGEINAQLGADPAYTASVKGFLSRLSPAFAERLR